MKELLIMAKSLGGGGSEVALIELINALPEEVYNITLVLLDSDNEYAYRLKKKVNIRINCSLLVSNGKIFRGGTRLFTSSPSMSL